MGHHGVSAHPSAVFLPEQSGTKGCFRTATEPWDAGSGDEALQPSGRWPCRTLGVEVEEMPACCGSVQLTWCVCGVKCSLRHKIEGLTRRPSNTLSNTKSSARKSDRQICWQASVTFSCDSEGQLFLQGADREEYAVEKENGSYLRRDTRCDSSCTECVCFLLKRYVSPSRKWDEIS